MRMRQSRSELNLEPESLRLDLGRDFARQDFYRDPPAELSILRHEDATHCTAEQLPLEGVRITQRQCQRFNKVGQLLCLLIPGRSSFD
jgi:hypothetical protein